MSDYSLLIYKKGCLKSYIEKRRTQGIKVYSLSYLEIHQDNINHLIELGEYDVDLTSAVQLMLNNNSTRYFIEKLIYFSMKHELHVNYIICESQLNQFIQELGYFFQHTERIICEENTLEENLEIEKHESSLKGKALLINEDLDELDQYLEKQLIGHSIFKAVFIEELRTFKYFYEHIGDQFIMSILLLGPSGIGKTELGKLLHKFSDTNSPVAKINFANYKNESSLASLIGSPPGYVDSGNESDLVQKINKSKVGVLIVDEFEKANSSVHNFFLQLLEEGQFDDALGNIHNLKGYILLFTSNASKENFLKETPPELRSRFDLIFSFDPLTKGERIQFSRKIIDTFASKSKIKLSKEDTDLILSNIDIENENNLRNLKKTIRRNFYQFVNKQQK